MLLFLSDTKEIFREYDCHAWFENRAYKGG